jgi:hypothetical protein
MALPNEVFMEKIFVDRNIKQLVEDELVWEKYLTKQVVGPNPVVLYYREQYFDVETPNDVALSKTLDPGMRTPAYRSEHGLFPHADAGVPKEYNLRLYQLALEMDYSEEEIKFAELENRVLKKQEKLANYFASHVNNLLGGILAETWSATPSGIQYITTSAVWSTYTSSDPIKDIMDAIEKVDDVAGYNYKPDAMLCSKQSYYDLLLYFSEKNYEYMFDKPNTRQEVLQALGLNIVKTNMVKRDYAMVGDLKAAGVLFESEPVETRVYFEDDTRDYHMQVTRRFNYALTDPKAICMIVNTA